MTRRPSGTISVQRILRPPDPLMLDAGAEGEILVARIRLLLTALLVLIPLFAVPSNTSIETLIGLGTALAAFLLAISVYLLVRQGFYRPWLGMLTSILDVSMVSGALAMFLVVDLPHTAVNSRVVFEVYFLAIAASCLRYDVRICLVAGLLTLIQYGAIVWYAQSHWDLNNDMFAPFRYGMFDWGSQVSRLVILFAASILSTAVVLRAQRLRRLSTSDRLTGLMNRGYFDERMTSEVSRARRYNHPMSVAMIDVDHFKRFNDTMGHAAGDAALQVLASTIRGSLRQSDVIARYGGEEFVVILPMTPLGVAVDKIEAMRLEVASQVIDIPKRGVQARLTISAGVACLPEDGLEEDDLLDLADRRLFQAKQEGRNKVVGTPGSGRPRPSASDIRPVE
ncbi:MAG TPA: GGDEF domain-containing protein [Gemmatimonadales bacterium]|nr:GGDEF domain-containing protein [Gemmatimonadales bacterium]